MVPLAELDDHAVSFRAADQAGVHDITVRRFKSGQVGMTCNCDDSRLQGWCRHRLDALCGRFAKLQSWDAGKQRALRQLVGGTLLEEDAAKLDVLLKDFDGSLKAFDKGRPDDVTGDNLSVFTELVSDLAAAAAELEDAVGRMRRRFEVGESLIRKAAPHAAVAE